METMATASGGATASSLTVTAASILVKNALGEATTTDSCWTRFPVPSLGLLPREQVMRGGNIRDPCGLEDIEAILRGGLERPYILTDLHTEDNKQFYQLQKWRPGLCRYLKAK